MKRQIHPQSQPVVFQDVTTGATFLVQSVVETAETTVWTDGRTYPLMKVEISSDSHPAFTGKEAPARAQTAREAFEKKYTKREWIN